MDRHGLGQCLGAVEVEARENPSGLAATKYRAASEAGYTSAVVTIEPDPVDLLQSGGVHIRPHMTQSGHQSRGSLRSVATLFFSCEITLANVSDEP